MHLFTCEGGRLLLHTAPQSEAAAAATAAAAEKRAQKSKAQPGQLVTGTVMHSSPLSADIKLESGALRPTTTLAFCAPSFV